MSTRYFALIYGIIFLVIGLLGFVPSLLTPIVDAPNLAVESGYGRLFDAFPVNILHNLIHMAIGVFGIFAYNRYDASRGYARSMAVVYGVLTLMGLLPFANTTFGLVPIFGNDVWLHLVASISAAVFGFRTREVSSSDRATASNDRFVHR